jgi:hypothetical protein
MVLRASRYKDKEKLRKTRNAQNKRYFSKTAIYKPRRWTDIEDVIVLEHKNTDMQISKQIERSVKAIQVRRVKLKKIEERKKMNRNLDGMYFRIERNGKFENVCFSDMTEAEQREVLKDKPIRFVTEVALEMAKRLHEIGEEIDLECKDE